MYYYWIRLSFTFVDVNFILIPCVGFSPSRFGGLVPSAKCCMTICYPKIMHYHGDIIISPIIDDDFDFILS